MTASEITRFKWLKERQADIQTENENTHIHYLHTSPIYIFMAIMYRNITANTLKK